MTLPSLTIIQTTIGIAFFWLLLGVASLLFGYIIPGWNRIVFLLTSLGAIVLMVCGVSALSLAPVSVTLPLGLPNLPFHFRLDALSAFFIIILGGGVVGASFFAGGYFRNLPSASLTLLTVQTHVFLASMLWVLLSADAYGFMVSWEMMALSSYFLIITDHTVPEVRRTGFVYLLITHVGALAILLCFGLLGGQGGYTFAGMQKEHLSILWCNVAFILALFGFGAKAGILPWHVWLPGAHSAAPSPISALLSGVMLKMAIYGFLRVVFDLLSTLEPWWGILTLTLGILTALYGIIFAAVQTDMKRILAYSSIENMGFIIAGVGLAILFQSYRQSVMATLALAAVLYHCLNHAFFKSLLFLGTGSVLHATGERNLGKLGGLIHQMPQVASLTLIGVLAMAGLPPLNGFVSEWLLLQAFLFFPNLPTPLLTMLIPVAASVLALTFGLAGFVAVKFFGIIFLGRPREEKLKSAHEPGWWERAGLIWLALGCVLLGLLPTWILPMIERVPHFLFADGVFASNTNSIFLTPIASARASYSPILYFLVIACIVFITFSAIRKIYHGRRRRERPWGCGYPLQTVRMQDSAEGFGQPIKHIFAIFFRMESRRPTPFDATPHYQMKMEDRIWHYIYLPLAKAVYWLSGIIVKLQRGQIAIYLLYSFLTLFILLLFIQ